MGIIIFESEQNFITLSSAIDLFVFIFKFFVTLIIAFGFVFKYLKEETHNY